MSVFFFENVRVVVFPGVYEPREDTLMVLESIDVRKGDRVIDMGCGCGIVSIVASVKGGRCIAVDISRKAVKNACYNAKVNRVSIRVVRSDLFSAFKKRLKVERVYFNAPYIPEDPTDEESLSWAGGKRYEVIKRFLVELREGVEFLTCLLVVRNDAELIGFIESIFPSCEVIERKRFFFEEIAVVRIER